MAVGYKTGGRKKGVENKVTRFAKKTISHLLDQYAETGLLAKDFLELEPRDRLYIFEKLVQYIVPKMSATSVDINDENNNASLFERINKLTKE